MRKLLLLCGLLAAGSSAQASEYATSFTFGSAITGANYLGLHLDITKHKRYLSASGAINAAGGLSAPVSGSCQFTAAGGVFCLLQSGFVSYILDLGPNLSGIIRAQDPSGNVTSSASVALSNLE